MGVQINSAKDLNVYKRAYALSMAIYHASKNGPRDERFALTDQIRRSSRAVCTNLREAWAKRRCEAHFVSKLTDCDGENSETDTWLDYAHDCGCLTAGQHRTWTEECAAVGAMLGKMLNNPKPFLVK